MYVVSVTLNRVVSSLKYNSWRSGTNDGLQLGRTKARTLCIGAFISLENVRLPPNTTDPKVLCKTYSWEHRRRDWSTAMGAVATTLFFLVIGPAASIGPATRTCEAAKPAASHVLTAGPDLSVASHSPTKISGLIKSCCNWPWSTHLPRVQNLPNGQHFAQPHWNRWKQTQSTRSIVSRVTDATGRVSFPSNVMKASAGYRAVIHAVVFSGLPTAEVQAGIANQRQVYRVLRLEQFVTRRKSHGQSQDVSNIPSIPRPLKNAQEAATAEGR